MEDRYIYKAKRVDNGEWVQGALFNGESHCIIGQEIKFSPYTEHECKIVGYEVDRDTICQCTGLKDKNGKLIWENDIVTGWFDGKRITGYIMYGSNATFFIERKGLYGIHLDNSEDLLEVIGNIFDEGSENIGKGAEEN